MLFRSRKGNFLWNQYAALGYESEIVNYHPDNWSAFSDEVILYNRLKTKTFLTNISIPGEQSDWISPEKQTAESIAKRVAKFKGQKRPSLALKMKGAGNHRYGKTAHNKGITSNLGPKTKVSCIKCHMIGGVPVMHKHFKICKETI